MLSKEDFIKRIDPFTHSGKSNFIIPNELQSAAEKLPDILRNGGGMNRKHVHFSSSLWPLSGVIDTSRELRLDILGFGNLAQRFSLQGLADLMGKNRGLKVQVTASDIYDENDKHWNETRGNWLNTLRSQFWINFQYLRRPEYEKRLASEPSDIVMIATPPTSHAQDLEDITQILRGETKTVIGVEKPFMHLDIQRRIRRLLANSPQRICDIDFFNQGKAFLWLMTSTEWQDILGKFGKPAVINGNCVETMTEWRDWMFDQSVSGGGSFVDCGSHNVNMMYVFMHHVFSKLELSTDFGTPNITNALFGRYHWKDELRETYNLLQVKWKDVLWNIQDGKALPKTAYNLETMNENGDYLLVSVGTQFHPPFVLFAPNSGCPNLYTLDGPGVGYEQIFERLIVMSANPKKEVFPNPVASRHASFEVLLELEKQVRHLQKNTTDWINYDKDTPIVARSWPHSDIHLPVTDDAFGHVEPL